MTNITLKELYTSIVSDLRNRMNVSTIIGKVALNAFALVQAAKLKLFYNQSAFVYKNVFPDQADPENLGGSLQRFGVVKLGRLPNPATAGVYVLDVTGEIGAVIPPGTTYKSLDTSTSPSKLFILDSTFTFTATTGQIQIRALDLGTEARLEVDDQLQVTQPISAVDSFADVATVVTAPISEESIEEYRTAVISSYQLESQGGARTDYRLWAQDADGVKEVYPYVNEPGIIDLYVEVNPDDSTDGNGTPSQAILDDVEEVIEFDPDVTKPLDERGRRPMGTFQINYLPITPLPVNVDIIGLTDESFFPVILDGLVALFAGIRPFVDGADNPNDTQKGFLYESDVYGIVRGAIGANAKFDSLTVRVNSVVITIYEFTDGDIPFLNSLTNA